TAPPPPRSYCSQRRFLGRRRASGHHLGWHRSQKNRAILLFPSDQSSHRNLLCSPENAKIRPVLTHISRSSFSLISSPNLTNRTIVSDPTVRSEPNLQDECPIPYRTQELLYRSLEVVSRGVGYPALRQAPYVALVVPAYGEIM
ncbi:AP2/B3-like transcriptional factor family protein, partial [Prunus dulcis]